jgi:hypothetical protein
LTLPDWASRTERAVRKSGPRGPDLQIYLAGRLGLGFGSFPTQRDRFIDTTFGQKAVEDLPGKSRTDDAT